MKAITVVIGIGDSSGGDISLLTWDLHQELRTLHLDPQLVETTNNQDGAKSLGSIAREVAIQCFTIEGIRSAVAAVVQWVRRTQRSVRVEIDGDTLVIGNATAEQQDKIIEAFIASHTHSV